MRLLECGSVATTLNRQRHVRILDFEPTCPNHKKQKDPDSGRNPSHAAAQKNRMRRSYCERVIRTTTTHSEAFSDCLAFSCVLITRFVSHSSKKAFFLGTR
jgi:hypothetical protein